MSFVIRQGLFLLDIADHYAVLGLPVDAGSKTVRKAYLKIAQRLHPDTCKAKDAAEKQLASELLSKLVNPAYEQLSKPVSWSEFQVVIKQLSKQLNQKSDTPLKLKSAIAQDLVKDLDKLEVEYHNKVREVAQTNYRDLSTTLDNIGALSELNLVFLKNTVQENTGLLSNSTSPGRTTRTNSRTTSSSSPASVTPERNTTAPAKTTTSSSLEAAIWRGEQHLKKKKFAKATLEFREAIKLDPNSVRAHALMGISYLQQKQIAMAKVHIKKAYMAKPSDPLARKAKQLLEKAMGSALETQTGSKKSGNEKKGGLFGGLFGGKKK
ncbi:heat shock protein DnaJ domain protein [[Leptolyngbya] sp. PCC 7376]|uniref:J domain-containing protein n=1 Tax=[Leptolyngbya] sp. PCC 7376 TaxID=111781 RepID=UPI00029EDE9A|nr:DnaJ domain-containing protein [[Leptolyngbya] sp. PCC 7376]AFY39588.1 heat shock protein DnaJ domain protein [[Leptolyngbya] sp. PCC 7376]